MVEDRVAKTVFLTCYGLYEWMVLLMGLTNALAAFVWAMNNFFANLLDCGIIVFLDNVLVYSHTRDEHFQ